MSGELEVLLRGPRAYDVAKKALEAMEASHVWPTAQNFELWLHYVTAKDGPLGREIGEIIARKDPFTEQLADELAARHLPKAKLNGEILTAGQALTRELSSVSKAIESVRETNEAYGAELASASQSLDGQETEAVKQIVDTLATATQRVQRENQTLESQLADSTAEVTRLREHLEAVRRDAMTDGLTNLANRRAFDEALAAEIEAAERDRSPLSLAIVDIDHFKSFNDTWGHQTGDQVIRYVASVISRAGARMAARYGGEEFALILPGVDSRAACALLDAIREEVGTRVLKRRSTNEDLGAVTVSAGIAEHAAGEPATSFIERADAALYASKRGGRNRVTDAGQIAAAA
jgi:diguanylate cyclase